MVSKPHGGKLINIESRKEDIDELHEFPKVQINEGIAVDIGNIANGIYSPLTGFLRFDEYSSVINNMRLPNDDIPWSIPIVLDITEKEKNFKEGDEVILYHKDTPIATIKIDEIYKYDKKEFAKKVFKTDESLHPGVSKIYKLGEYLVGGDILNTINELPNPFKKYTLNPTDTRALFKKNGWNTVAAFQTRNVPHLGHEYLQKLALTFVDGVFVNPVLGKKKKGDYKDEVILKAYETLFEHYYPKNVGILSTVRYEMRYAGPREAIHHAIMRKNFGCTHFIVGRDHAGVGNYYGPYEAQEIFKEFPDLGIEPIFFREFYYCKKCNAIVHERICPHTSEYREHFSGTKIRNMIVNDELPPKYFMRKEVYETIKNFEDPFVGD